MAINTLETAILFQQQLDDQMIQEATSGWMEANAGQVKYSGGKDVKIPKLTMDGLADYDRDNGYAQGSVTLEYETETMTKDRGRKFQLDAMDVDESAFIASAANVTTRFQREKVIPEVDAYRYGKLATLAIGAKQSGDYTPATGTILGQLLNDISNMQDIIGETEPLVISMGYKAATLLSQADKIEKILTVADFAQGGINTKVQSLDGTPIKRIPSARFKSAFAFTSNGFLPYAKSSVTIDGVKYTSASVGSAGNAYTVTVVQGSGASVVTAGVVDASGNLVITLGTSNASNPLSVKASAIAALAFTGAGAALITATSVSDNTVQVVTVATTLSGGAGSGSEAQDINWIISAMRAPIAVSKTDKMKIFDPNTNQNADAWLIEYRKFHDLWVPDNKLPSIYVSTKPLQ